MSTFGSNVTIKISNPVTIGFTTANTTAVQTVYTAPTGGYAILNISFEGTPTTGIPGSTQGATLKIANTKLFQVVSGANNSSLYQLLKPNGYQELSDGSGNQGGINFFDAVNPLGVSFIGVYIAGGQSITVQKTAGILALNINVAGVEFINTP
jgi:hypothetical protein